MEEMNKIKAMLQLDKILLASDKSIITRFMKYDFTEDEAKELCAAFKAEFKESIINTIKARLGA